MKRTSIPFLLAAIIAVALGFSLQHDPSLEAGAFAAQFREALQKGGFAVLSEATAGPDEVPLPISIRWHPRRWLNQPATQPVTGFADGATHYVVSRGGAPSSPRLECFVRYLGGRAQFISIRADGSNAAFDASDLRAALRLQYPDFPVTLDLQ